MSLLPELRINSFLISPVNSESRLVPARCRACGFILSGTPTGGLQLAEADHVTICSGVRKRVIAGDRLIAELRHASHELSLAEIAWSDGDFERACTHLQQAGCVLEKTVAVYAMTTSSTLPTVERAHIVATAA